MKQKVKCVRCIFLLLYILMAALATGCGRTNESIESGNEETEPKEVVPTGIYVPVAEIRLPEYEGFSSYSGDYFWQGDSMLSMEADWNQDTKVRTRSLYRIYLDGVREPELLMKEEPGKYMMDVFFTDREDNLYLLGRESTEEGTRYYYRKMDREGRELFVTYPEADSDFSEKMRLVNAYGDGGGNGYILDRVDKELFLFDAEGNYLGSQKVALENGSLIDAGDGGVFLWDQNFQQEGVDIQFVDLAKLAVSEVKTVSFSSILKTGENYTILSGYEEGLLLSTTNTLYQYDINSGEAKELFNWNDSKINLDGSIVEAMRSIKRTEQGNLEFEALLNYWMVEEMEIAAISYVDKAYVPERQVITYGIPEYYNSFFKEDIKKFNRENQKYEIQVVNCDEFSLRDALLYGKDVPDLLDPSILSVSMLEEKGLLTDLEPYFEKSDVVHRDDILEGIWEAGIANGKMVAIATQFQIDIYVTTAETITKPGYGLEDILRMQKEYPDTRMFDYCNATNVMSFMMGSEMDKYVNWEKGKASFDSKEFIRFLEALSEIPFPKDPSLGRNQTIRYVDDMIKSFLNGDYLIYSEHIGNPMDYQQTRRRYENKAYLIGSPSRDGEPCFGLYPTKQFCIYEKSDCKDGAWAFIEYMLSKEQQSWYASEYQKFPVRKDEYFDYLEKPYGPGEKYADMVLSEEYRDEITYMCEHMFIDNFRKDTQIYEILIEEVQALLAGDKTAKETAKIIQSRVQLYMNE